MIDVPSRYSRQALFPGLGAEGQAALMRSSVVVVGCGGLGALQASLLVRAGVGTVRIIDRDLVEESNLHRQLLYDEDDARRLQPKAAIAAQKLRSVNSLVRVEGIVDELNAATIERLLGGFDLVLDATDNFAARYLLNDYCVKTATPWVYGACVGAHGMTISILPGDALPALCLCGRPAAGRRADGRHRRRAGPDRRRHRLAAGRRGAQDRRRTARSGESPTRGHRRLGHRPADARAAGA